MLKMNFTENDEFIRKRDRAVRLLKEITVDIGLTSTASERSRFLLAIHTHGSPVMRIPPRPVVQPALNSEAVQAEITQHFINACEAAMNGDSDKVISEMKAGGQAGADGIRKYIDKGIPPPNAPVTLTGGWIWNRVAKKPVKVEPKRGSTPLKDTGQLYNDFDYEIRRK